MNCGQINMVVCKLKFMKYARQIFNKYYAKI